MEQEKSEGRGFLSHLDIWALSFGAIIGWGAFIMPGTMFLPNAGPSGTVIAMVLGALVMLIIGKNFSLMAEKYPDNGGLYAYTRNVLGHDHGFLCAWSLGLAYLCLIWANATAFVLLARYLFGDLLQWGLHYTVAGFDVYLGEILFTWLILGIFYFLSCLDRRRKRHLQTVLALLMVLSVAALFLGVSSAARPHAFEPGFQPWDPPVLQVFSMLMLAPWMFFGFEAVTQASEDFSFPARSLYPVIVAAVVTGALTYCFFTSIAVLSVPHEHATWLECLEALHGETGLASLPVFKNVYSGMGEAGLVLLGVAVLATLSTSLLAFYRGAGYLFRSMAGDGLLPEKFSRTDEGGVPRMAFLLALLISLPVPFLGRTAIAWLTDITTISGSIAYGYVSLCVYRTAKEEGRVAGIGLGAAGFLFSLLFFFCPILPGLLLGASLGEESYLLLSAWSLLGFVYYWHVFRKDRLYRYGRSASMFIASLFLNFFSTSLWLREITARDLEQAAWGTGQADFLNLSVHSLVQISMVAVILLLIAHIFTTLKERERQTDLKMLQEREISQAKNALLSNISHDINIPMRAIMDYVQVSLETSAACYVCGEECSSRVPKALGDALTKVELLNQYLSSLLSDMQLLERLENDKIKMKEHVTDLKLTMQVLEDVFALQAQEKRLYFTVDTGTVEDSLVITDEERLSRMLLNLMANACQYTPEGGGVMVTLAQIGPRYNQKKTEHGRLAFRTYGDYEFRVHDTGPGMDPKEAQEAMAPFEGEKTTQDLLEAGRGLHIVRNIAGMLGGKLQVLTEPGRGTEIILSLTLPLAPK